MRKLASLLTFLLFSNILLAQDCLTGIVVDSKSKEPLEGAAIRMRGSNLGVTTANDGRFTICPQNTNQAVFIVSFLGYETREFEFPENQNITIELTSSPYKLERVVVTATLTPQPTWEVPAMVSVIDEVNVSNSPATNVDNFLRTIPNLFVDRSKGVFSKNASITMRGLDGSNRVLILYDGMPLNKTSYGFINWSLVSPDLVDQIEVVHGPSSALFGNNAMAGVINIRTKEPKNLPLYGSVIAEAGGFGFMGSRATVGGKFSVFGKDVRIMVNGFWREGDGYVAEPPEIRDSTNVPLYLKEKGLTYKMLIPSADSSHFYVSGNVYTDKRGAGRAVYLEDGSFDSYTTSRTQVGYRGNVSGFSVDMNAYVQYEVYNRQNESLNSTGDNYRIFHTDQISGDVGIWLSASKPLGKTNRFTFGADTKHGWMDAHDIYRTSTDQVVRYGKVTFGALFAQDDLMDLLEQDSVPEVNYATATFKSTRIMNGHSIEKMPAGQLDFRISHRFGLLSSGPYEFFGLDQLLSHHNNTHLYYYLDTFHHGFHQRHPLLSHKLSHYVIKGFSLTLKKHHKHIHPQQRYAHLFFPQPRGQDRHGHLPGKILRHLVHCLFSLHLHTWLQK